MQIQGRTAVDPTGEFVGEAVRVLDEIVRCELAGVVRYTHYALMVTGPHRTPLVEFMKAQAVESLTHAQAAGEVLTGLGGHPTLATAPIEESGDHTVESMLAESLAHETRALGLYKDLLAVVGDRSVYLEEFARGMIGQEELHTMELGKMLRRDGREEPATDA